MNPSQKTYHQKNFEGLKTTARQIAMTLTANPTPNHDQIENVESYFKTLDKMVKNYCEHTPKAAPVQQKYDASHAEWQKVKTGKGDIAKLTKEIAKDMQWVSNSPYVAPTGAVERPSTPTPHAH